MDMEERQEAGNEMTRAMRQLGLTTRDIEEILSRDLPVEATGSLGPGQYPGGFYGAVSIDDLIQRP